ncbi:MAG: penicillin acylase family protein [Nocardioidaceae bacterium]
MRARGVDYDLPRWGDAAYDWNGWLPDRPHVQQVNPPAGFLVSSNNKTAPGFSAADDVWWYGSVYRRPSPDPGGSRAAASLAGRRCTPRRPRPRRPLRPRAGDRLRRLVGARSGLG